MVSEEKIKALVGHEFPGGEYTIKHWENFLFTECTGSKPMQDSVVHPSVLFHVPILGCNTTITEMMDLGYADGPDSIMIEGYEWDMFHPLKEDVSYKATGKITEASRCVGGTKNVYDRIQFLFELVDPEGELTARSVVTWCYIRRRWAEKLIFATLALTIWMKQFYPAKMRTGIESFLLKAIMEGIPKMFPKRPTGE